MKTMYKHTWTYQGKVELSIFNCYIFNHGTESSKSARTNQHISDCKAQTLNYEVLYEASDRQFGTEVIAPIYDKIYVKKIVAELNDTVLKKSSKKALTFKDWKDSLPVLTSVERGYYDALEKANLSETECCIIPDTVSKSDLDKAIQEVNSWYYNTKSLRRLATAYQDKTDKEKKIATKPIPKVFHKKIISAITTGVKEAKLLNCKFIRVQSIDLAYEIFCRGIFKNAKFKVIAVANDIEEHKETYEVLKRNSRFEIVYYDNDIDIIEEYMNMEVKPDLDIMNPPYDGSLHLEILETVLANKKPGAIVVSIQPARWLEDPLAEYKLRTDYKKYKITIFDKLSNLQLINFVDANDVFKIGLNGVDLGIYLFADETNYTLDIYSSLATSIINKVRVAANECNLKQHANIVENRTTFLAGKYYVRVNEMIPFATTGGTKHDNVSTMQTPWTTLITQQVYTAADTDAALRHTIECDTETQAEIIIDSYNTDAIYNLMQLIKSNQHSPLQFIPYVNNLTKALTSEDWCKYWKLTLEETEFMCRKVDDYRIKDFINYINLYED